MTVNCNNCNKLAPPQLHGLKEDEGTRPSRRVVRVAVRCPRQHCGGQLGIASDLLGHMWDVSCPLCARALKPISGTDLVEKHGLTFRALDRAKWSAWAPLWHRIEVTS